MFAVHAGSSRQDGSGCKFFANLNAVQGAVLAGGGAATAQSGPPIWNNFS
jgi:hypothetical protein